MKAAKTKLITAFTLAELMVIMAVMTVVLAAVAPIFTSRYSNLSLDNVWSGINASNMNDISADAPIRSMMQQLIIGATPIDLEDVRRTYQPYSKLIIRSGNKINGDKLQKQIEFRYNGTKNGYLFAGNSNLLLGGNYNKLSFTYEQPNLSDITAMNIGIGATGNTALGRNALDSVTSGIYNTAFGYNTLKSLTTGSANTAVGVGAGASLTTGNGNVFVGYNSYNAATGDYNTVIGNNTSSKSSVSNYTTAVGNNINVKGDYNVAIGDSSNAGGYYNTAISYGALSSENPSSDSYDNFKFNTAVGYNACKGISSSAQGVTCIGGSGVDPLVMSQKAQSFYNNRNDVVLIGRPASAYNSAATLEVHSGGSSSSVVVNGNLIVRGQTYMTGRSPFPIAPFATQNTYANTIALMGYRLYKESALEHKPLIGVDGSEYTQRMKNSQDYMREAYTGREHCICNYSCSATQKDYFNGKGFAGRDSYDWSYLSLQNYNNKLDTLGGYSYFGHSSHKCGESYNDSVFTSANVELDRAHNLADGVTTSGSETTVTSGSCCPILTPTGIKRTDNFAENVPSDIKLKNLGSLFERGLDAISKLNIYNYSFKNDKSKSIHAGVIAQDLKKVFPNSVIKDKKGYYQIRRDEIFYAAINSVKELYTKFTAFKTRIEKDIERIVILKKENKILKDKLIMLSKELDNLEK